MLTMAKDQSWPAKNLPPHDKRWKATIAAKHLMKKGYEPDVAMKRAEWLYGLTSEPQTL